MPGSAAPLSSFDRLALSPAATALFLDFDGTLADIVDTPGAVTVHPAMPDLLARLDRSTGGAVAIVTGRAIDDVDRFLAPLQLPMAGVHGMQRRGAGGDLVAVPVDEHAMATVRRRLEEASAAMPGTLVETKPGSVVLHYRRRPELAAECIDAAHMATKGIEGLQILHGKMVVEIKTGGATKGDAVAAFMVEAPFHGRVPVFAGDDVTDEDAFQEVARRSGVSIKIGDGDTAAKFRTDGTTAFRRWLSELADGFEAPQPAG